MTTAEPAVRKPTAKELAEEAKELAEEAKEIGSQLRAELTELRNEVRESGSATGTSERPGDAELARQVAKLDGDMEGFVKDLNELAARISAPVGDDAEVRALEKKTADSFASFSKIIDRHNTAASQAIAELREQMPSVAQLANRVEELAGKVQLFDEAGVGPVSAEDVDSLDSRLKHVEKLIAELRLMLSNPTDQPSVDHALAEMGQRVTEGLGDVRHEIVVLHRRVNDAVTQRMINNTETPGGSTAGPQVIDLHGNQVAAIYGQVWQLMNMVTELGKDKTADKKMGGYAFRSIDAAMDAVGRAMRVVGVMFQPREILDKRIERYETVSKDGYRQNWTHVWVTQRYAFVSLTDGSEMDAIEMDGEARDNGDKSTSKSDSMRYKYALLQALCIPINGLPESDGRDGTEGGQVHGRGDAGESWENATPAPPRVAHEQHADSRPPSTPEEVETGDGTAYGYGHQPADSPGGQAHAQAAQQADEDTRTPEEKATAAYHALVALAGIEAPARRPRLDKILRGITSAGIGEIMIQTVDGRQVTLHQYAATVNAQVGV